MFSAAQEFFVEYGDLLGQATLDTVIIVTASTIIAYVFGILIAMLFVATVPRPGVRSPIVRITLRVTNAVMGWIVNMGRSIPFILLIVILIPLTRIISGTGIDLRDVIVPLTIGAIPFVARMVESSFSEVSPGKIEAGRAFGASTVQILFKVYMKESLPSIIRGAAISYITLLGYSAIAGAVGSGGLGMVALQYGYYRYEFEVLLVALLILIVIVQIVQSLCDIVAKSIDKR